VDGKIIGTSKSGLFSESLAIGSKTVTASANDYEVDSKFQIVDISESMPAKIAFTFHPSRAALEASGASYFKRMIEALGGEDGLKESWILRGRGTLTSQAGDRKHTVWGIRVLIKSPDKAKFEVTKDGKTSEGARTELGMDWSNKGKGPELEELGLCLQKFQENNLFETIGRLRSPGFRVSTEQLQSAPGEPLILRALGGVEAYSIKLDSAFRPIEIASESEGVNEGMKILYSDYIQQDHSFYPKSTQILLPDAPHALEMRFDEFVLNPVNVKETDFEPMKKGVFRRIFGK
jgi:hypothetical protein